MNPEIKAAIEKSGTKYGNENWRKIYADSPDIRIDGVYKAGAEYATSWAC